MSFNQRMHLGVSILSTGLALTKTISLSLAMFLEAASVCVSSDNRDSLNWCSSV